MSYIYNFTSSLGPRRAIQFYDPLNPTNNWVAPLNPTTMTRTPNNVRVYTEAVNNGAVILGDREYPPKEILMTWNQLDQADFFNLVQFANISPIVFVDNRNNGYLGVLVFTEVAQLADVTKDVFSVKAQFLVLSPYNGTSTTLNQLAVPTISASLSSTPGVMADPTTLYVWATVFTRTGESTVGSVLTISNTNASAAYNISFTAPTSKYYRKLRLYWNSTNNSSTATMLTEIQNGFPLGSSPSFTIYSGYIPYNLANPPTYSSAFTGFWAGGYWQSDT